MDFLFVGLGFLRLVWCFELWVPPLSIPKFCFIFLHDCRFYFNISHFYKNSKQLTWQIYHLFYKKWPSTRNFLWKTRNVDLWCEVLYIFLFSLVVNMLLLILKKIFLSIFDPPPHTKSIFNCYFRNLPPVQSEKGKRMKKFY